VDRVARVGDEDDITGRRYCLGEVGEALFGSERDDNLALRIDLDVEAARVITGAGASQPRNSTRHRISVSSWILYRLDEFGDDVRWCRATGVAHAEIDDISPSGARLRLQRVDLTEYVRGQALDTVEVVGHGVTAGGECPLLGPQTAYCERYTPARQFLKRRRNGDRRRADDMAMGRHGIG